MLQTILSFLGISYSKTNFPVQEYKHKYNDKEKEVAEILKQRRMKEDKDEDDYRVS